MKSIYFFFISTIFSLSMRAQITINESDVANGGDSFIISNGDVFMPFDAAETGPDYTWDFSSLTYTSQDTDVWVNAIETNAAYFLLWFSSDIANASGQNIDLVVVTFEDIYNFYDRSASQLAITGTAGTISGIPLPAAFDGDDVIYKFPLTYGNTDSSDAEYALEIPGIGGWSEHRHRVNTVDGWGTLLTPYGTFDALRVKSDLQTNDSISSALGGFPFSYLTHEYKWLGKTQGIPLLQITTQDVFGFETISKVVYRDSLRTEEPPLALTEADIEQAQIALFPNPVSTSLHIAVTSENDELFSASIVDMQGKSISNIYNFNTVSGKNIFEIPLASFHMSAGMYAVKYMIGQNPAQVKMFVVK